MHRSGGEKGNPHKRKQSEHCNYRQETYHQRLSNQPAEEQTDKIPQQSCRDYFDAAAHRVSQKSNMDEFNQLARNMRKHINAPHLTRVVKTSKCSFSSFTRTNGSDLVPGVFPHARKNL